MVRRSACLVIGLVVLGGCGGGHSAPAGTARARARPGHSAPTDTARASARGGCPVSTPAGPRPPKRALQNFGTPMAKPSDPGWYGNEVLWTQLRADTTFLRAPGGKLTMKMPWFRGAPGPMAIEGRPLFGPPARFSARVDDAGYGTYGFVPAGLVFGRPGCWLLRAHLAGRVLSVVLDVRQPPRRVGTQTAAALALRYLARRD